MFTLYADFHHDSLDRLVASQVRPCESRNTGTRNGTRNGSNVVSHRKLSFVQKWCRKSRSTVASQQLLRVTEQLDTEKDVWLSSLGRNHSESLSDRVRLITSHLAILQGPKLTDWWTDLAVAPEPAKLNYQQVDLAIVLITMCAFTMCACAFILFLVHFIAYFHSVFRSAFRLSQLPAMSI